MAITKEQALVGTKVRFTGISHLHLKGKTGNIVYYKDACEVGVTIDGYNGGHNLGGRLNISANNGYYVTAKDLELISNYSSSTNNSSYPEQQFISGIDVKLKSNPEYEDAEYYANKVVRILRYAEFDEYDNEWIVETDHCTCYESDIVGYEKPNSTPVSTTITPKNTPKVTVYGEPPRPIQSYVVGIDPYKTPSDNFIIDESIFKVNLPVLNTNN